MVPIVTLLRLQTDSAIDDRGMVAAKAPKTKHFEIVETSNDEIDSQQVVWKWIAGPPAGESS